MKILKTLKTLIILLHLTVLKTCPNSPGLQNPSQILSKYIQSLLQTLSLKTEKTKIALIYYDEQITELKVFRFIFKILQISDRFFYIGILSIIKGEELLKKNPNHEVIRFIQTSDFRDAQRLLGNYEADKEDDSGCDILELKRKFWEEFLVKNKCFFEVQGNVKEIRNFAYGDFLKDLDFGKLGKKDLESFLKRVREFYGKNVFFNILGKEKDAFVGDGNHFEIGDLINKNLLSSERNNFKTNNLENNDNIKNLLNDNNLENNDITNLLNNNILQNNHNYTNLANHTLVNTNLEKHNKITLNKDNSKKNIKNKDLEKTHYSNNLQNENFISGDPFLKKYTIPKFQIKNNFSNSSYKNRYTTNLIN